MASSSTLTANRIGGRAFMSRVVSLSAVIAVVARSKVLVEGLCWASLCSPLGLRGARVSFSGDLRLIAYTGSVLMCTDDVVGSLCVRCVWLNCWA